MIPRIDAEYRQLDADWGTDTVEALHAMLDRVTALEAGRAPLEHATVPPAGAEGPARRRRRSGS
jgi:hypothetical protein